MATIIQQIFAYNTGAPIFGTTQVGDIAIIENSAIYEPNLGGLTWWAGPDQTLGYVIVYPVPAGDHPTPTPGVFSYIGFYGTKNMPNPFDESTFVELVNAQFNQNFTSGNDASTWLTTNGYWNSWVSITPTPTATLGVTPTPTPSVTNTQTPTTTTTNTPTPTLTQTPTPTHSTPSGFSVTIVESGGDVVMSASGSLNINDLILVNPSTGPYGGGGLGVNSATFLMGTTGVNFALYSGFTTTPSNFGPGAGGGGSTSTSGDVFGVIFQGVPPYELVVPVGYTTGTVISSTQTFAGETFSSLGLTPGTYTYTWTVPTGVTAPGNVNTFTTTKAGTYSVTITNNDGCTSAGASGIVTVNLLPTAPTVTSPTICDGNTATLLATATSTGTYTYTWTVPTGVTAPGNVNTFTSTKAGTYSVTITNDDGCSQFYRSNRKRTQRTIGTISN